MCLSQDELNQIKQDLFRFIENLPRIPENLNLLYLKMDEMRGGTCLSPEMNKQAMEQNMIILQNDLGKILLDLYRKEKWLAIKLLLLFNAQSRWLELNLIYRLADMNRWDEISRLYELLKQSRWTDIQTVCSLAYMNRWNEVTVRLAEMTAAPESRNLFNESMLTGELKDMYQHYLFLKNNNQMHEANKLYTEIVNIAESRAKKLNAAQIDVLKTKELHALNSTNPPSQTSSQDVESASNEKLTKSFYDECANRFIEEYHLLCGETPGDDGKYPVYIWEEKLSPLTYSTHSIEFSTE